MLITGSILIFVVNSIALVKPEKAKMMEGMLIQMARTGQIAGKVTMAFDYSSRPGYTIQLFFLHLELQSNVVL